MKEWWLDNRQSCPTLVISKMTENLDICRPVLVTLLHCHILHCLASVMFWCWDIIKFHIAIFSIAWQVSYSDVEKLSNSIFPYSPLPGKFHILMLRNYQIPHCHILYCLASSIFWCWHINKFHIAIFSIAWQVSYSDVEKLTISSLPGKYHILMLTNQQIPHCHILHCLASTIFWCWQIN